MSVPSPFVVIAEFQVKPGVWPTSSPSPMTTPPAPCPLNPAAEPLTSASPRPTRSFFYEVYDDRAAFDAHLETPHFARFRTAFRP